jgi:hypothetical protein
MGFHVHLEMISPIEHTNYTVELANECEQNPIHDFLPRSNTMTLLNLGRMFKPFLGESLLVCSIQKS